MQRYYTIKQDRLHTAEAVATGKAVHVSWRSACALPAELRRPAILFSTHWRHCSFFFPSIKLQASDLEEGEKGEFNTVVERVAPAV